MSFIAFLLFVLVVVNATTTTADARLYRYSVDHPPVFEHTPKLANPTLDCAIKELAWNVWNAYRKHFEHFFLSFISSTLPN